MQHESAPTVIQLTNVSKLFYKREQATLKEMLPALATGKRALNSFWALKDVSLDIHKGEVIGIIGSNGSGKSTLLKLIAGVTHVTQGSLSAQGRIVPLIELGAGFHGELTGRENVYLNGIILGMTRREIEKKIQTIIDFAEMDAFIDQPIKHYSSGMYLRLAFSVAVHLEPDIVLIDEILSVGDENFQRKSLNKIQEIISRNVTVVIVSHSLDLLSTLCTRVLWIEKGTLLAEGKPGDVITRFRQETFGARAKPSKTAASTTLHLDALFKEWGSMKCRIINLAIGNEKGQEKSVFQSGETMTVTLGYENPQHVRQLNVAIGIYRYDDVYISGMTTQLDDQQIEPAVAGQVRLELKDLPLSEGQFYIRAAIYGQLETDPYHFWHRAVTFEVQNVKKRSRGMLNLSRQWYHVSSQQ